VVYRGRKTRSVSRPAVEPRQNRGAEMGFLMLD